MEDHLKTKEEEIDNQEICDFDNNEDNSMNCSYKEEEENPVITHDRATKTVIILAYIAIFIYFA